MVRIHADDRAGFHEYVVMTLLFVTVGTAGRLRAGDIPCRDDSPVLMERYPKAGWSPAEYIVRAYPF
jgi:hypothetical protein